MGTRSELEYKLFNTIRGLAADLTQHAINWGVPKDNIEISLSRNEDGLVREGFVEIQLGNGLKFDKPQTVEVRIFDDDNYQVLLPSLIARSNNRVKFDSVGKLKYYLAKLYDS